jgi:ubiquinone/menaquinone biosynthesis C-methylase UbiE
MTVKSLSNSIKQAIAWEEKRKNDLEAGNFLAVRESYQKQKYFLPDDNRADFWDKRFKEQKIFLDGPFVCESAMEEWRIKKVISKINPRQSILNLGVGSGRLEARLLPKISPNLYLGTDITKQTLKQLRRAFPKYHFQKSKLDKLPLADGSFEQILLLEVLEHIRPNKTFQVLAEIKRVLKKNGTLFISVPVNEGLEKILPKNPSAHQRLYSLALIQFELEESGFTIQKIYQASAFAKNFKIKQLINSLLNLRQPNNFLLIARRN